MQTAVVIMAGGRGERFWPRSRNRIPKQFLPITHDSITMAEETIRRACLITEPENIFLSLRQDLVKTVQTLLPEFPEENLIIEPVGRDTAAAMGLATMILQIKRPGFVALILPSDHLIVPDETFSSNISQAVRTASEYDCLLTFGIRPTRPDTGYGYIETGELIHDRKGLAAYEVRTFREKPDRILAESYIKKGNYFWNSGIFVWKPTVFLSEMERYLPVHFRTLNALADLLNDPDYIEKALPLFRDLPAVSVDYGIMEKADNVLCIRADFQWDDVGSWTALERIRQKDRTGNITAGLPLLLNTHDSLIFNFSPDRLLAVSGIRGAVIVQTDDAVLVLDKRSEGDMKKLLNIIREQEKLHKFL